MDFKDKRHVRKHLVEKAHNHYLMKLRKARPLSYTNGVRNIQCFHCSVLNTLFLRTTPSYRPQLPTTQEVTKRIASFERISSLNAYDSRRGDKI